MKRKALFLAGIMILSVMMFAACGNSQSTADNSNQSNVGTTVPSEQLSKEAAYKVTVADAAGVPVSAGIAVKFMQNGSQVAMQLVNESGVAEKTLTRGDYTVELQFTDPKAPAYVYDTENMTLSAEKTELNVVLSQQLGENFYELNEGKAYYINEGCTNITLSPEGRSYYIFTPSVVGQYEFSLIGSDVPIGHFGGTVHYIWEHSAVDVIDNKFAVNIRAGQLGGAVVIVGVDAGEGDAILSVQNIGEPAWSVEDEPWEIYEPTSAIAAYSLPAGAKLNKFDITASADSYKLVRGSDGFYHLNSEDGPLVVVALGKVFTDYEYLPPMEVILEKQGIRRYFYAEDGTFLKKEEYSECVLSYIENADEAAGVYPLNDDLMYIIQQQGIQAGWFDETSPGYLFKNEEGIKVSNVNSEISWLFMCRYL